MSDESPVSSVCNLFESKMLLGEEKKRAESVKTLQMTRKQIAEEMSNIAKANRKLSEDISKKMKEVIIIINHLFLYLPFSDINFLLLYSYWISML